jgi:hypothetical protein
MTATSGCLHTWNPIIKLQTRLHCINHKHIYTSREINGEDIQQEKTNKTRPHAQVSVSKKGKKAANSIPANKKKMLKKTQNAGGISLSSIYQYILQTGLLHNNANFLCHYCCYRSVFFRRRRRFLLLPGVQVLFGITGSILVFRGSSNHIATPLP